MFSIPAMGETLYKDIRRDFVEKRYCWQTRINEQDKYGIEQSKHAGGEHVEGNSTSVFSPKGHCLECLFKGQMFLVEISLSKHLK